MFTLVNTVLKGKNSIGYYGSATWNLLLIKIRYHKWLVSFDSKIKIEKPADCPSTVCKDYDCEDVCINLSK